MSYFGADSINITTTVCVHVTKDWRCRTRVTPARSLDVAPQQCYKSVSRTLFVSTGAKNKIVSAPRTHDGPCFSTNYGTIKSKACSKILTSAQLGATLQAPVAIVDGGSVQRALLPTGGTRSIGAKQTTRLDTNASENMKTSCTL
jgi:hypothetical protein